MMTFENEIGLNAGLNKGLSLKKLTKQISLKNAIKVLPMATSLIPFGGGLVSKVLSSKVGKVVGKVDKSKLVKKGTSLVKTAQQIKKAGAIAFPKKVAVPKPVAQFSLPATTTDYGSASANFDAPIIQQGGKAVSIESGAPSFSAGGDFGTEPIEAMPVKELSPARLEQMGVAEPLNTEPKNNTMLYVGGAIAVAGIIYLATKKSN